MFARRIFLALTVATAMVAVVNAQSNQSGGWAAKMARKGQATSTQSVQVAATKNARTSTEDSNENHERVRLEGTWRATGIFSGGNEDSALFTFGAGKNANNGIVVHSDNFFLTEISCLPAQGVWKRTEGREFIVTDEAFCFDPESTPHFLPAGSIKFELAIELNKQGGEFDGTLHIEAFDVGNPTPVFTDDATVHGVRMLAEAPPH